MTDVVHPFLVKVVANHKMKFEKLFNVAIVPNILFYQTQSYCQRSRIIIPYFRCINSFMLYAKRRLVMLLDGWCEGSSRVSDFPFISDDKWALWGAEQLFSDHKNSLPLQIGPKIALEKSRNVKRMSQIIILARNNLWTKIQAKRLMSMNLSAILMKTGCITCSRYS